MYLYGEDQEGPQNTHLSSHPMETGGESPQQDNPDFQNMTLIQCGGCGYHRYMAAEIINHSHPRSELAKAKMRKLINCSCILGRETDVQVISSTNIVRTQFHAFPEDRVLKKKVYLNSITSSSLSAVTPEDETRSRSYFCCLLKVEFPLTTYLSTKEEGSKGKKIDLFLAFQQVIETDLQISMPQVIIDKEQE